MTLCLITLLPTKDYTWDIDARYDIDNPINNIAAMHDRIRNKEKKEADEQIRLEKLERQTIRLQRAKTAKERDAREKELNKRSKKSAGDPEFSQPIGIGFVSSLFNGI